MHRMTKKDFAYNNGWFCPFCYLGSIDYVENSASRLEETKKCLDCNAEWIEHHKVSHYTVIKKPSDELGGKSVTVTE